ncbi:MAG TPA: hypothetical protein VIB39_06540 [Candidatus Angelobacter sp.]
MAANKAKHSLHLAQAKPQPSELMPVKAHIYHAIADLNDGFQKTIHDLKQLQSTNFFNSERLAAMHDLLCKLRAQAKREFLNVLGAREAANSAHFDQPSGKLSSFAV